MRNITVEVFETDPRADGDAKAIKCGEILAAKEPVITVDCAKPIWGRFIRIHKHKNKLLTLCEVIAQGNFSTRNIVFFINYVFSKKYIKSSLLSLVLTLLAKL